MAGGSRGCPTRPWPNIQTTSLQTIHLPQSLPRTPSAAMASCGFPHLFLSIACFTSLLMSLLSFLPSHPYSFHHPLSISTSSFRLMHRFNRRQQLLDLSAPEQDTQNLAKILREAAMPDRTVIITTLNEAWSAQNTMIDLFLESFRVGNNTARFLNHLIIVALDQKAYDRCTIIHLHCFQLRTQGVDFSGEKVFMTSDYLLMMWRRIKFLQQVLEEGYNFFFSDADIMWLRDPFTCLSADADFQIACDHYNGYPKSLRNKANGGFVYARANRRTIKLYKYWYAAREVFPGKHDQYVFDEIKGDEALSEAGLRMEFFDTKYISGFCEFSKDMEKVVTVHANCCYGLKSKLDDLRRVLSDWKRFSTMTPSNVRQQNFALSAPSACVTSKKSMLQKV